MLKKYVFLLEMKVMRNGDEVISTAKPHTIKKFELIEKYVAEWAQKLCNVTGCKNLVFIDCMCNSGQYIDILGNTVYGTPVRVSKVLEKTAEQYPEKNIIVCFNDIDSKKTKHLSGLVPSGKKNFYVKIYNTDGNALLKQKADEILNCQNTHCLLVYDPYVAAIDWEAVCPFLNSWSEVMINHMVSDSVRATKVIKSQEAIDKYEHTYLTALENLISKRCDRKTYAKRVEKIIKTLHHGEKKFYIAAFPFFNSRNALVYDLIHYTTNVEGFKLYKKVAWKTFGGKSSTKDTHGMEMQLSLDFGDMNDDFKYQGDESCYYVQDIATYLQEKFRGRKNVPLSDLWKVLEEHPVFPSDSFRREIKTELKNIHLAKVSRNSVSFRN